MAIWYRAHQTRDVNMTFSGEGGMFVAGRWHYKGRKVVYCSQSISLCTLEWLSHHGLSVSGFSYHKYAIEVADNLIQSFDVKHLPRHWNQSPVIQATQDFAEKHLFNQTKYLALAVPSVIVPEEYNLVINPMHTAYAKVSRTVQKIGAFKAPKRY